MPTDPTRARIRELEAELAMLADAVITAACLQSGEIPAGSSEEGYASEVLHETASDLTRRYPRLRGAYKGAKR